MIVNCKGGKRSPVQKYESNDGLDLTNKGNPGGFRGECYNVGKSKNMDRDCLEPMKEEAPNTSQTGEDTQIKINLSEEDNYSDVEGFEILFAKSQVTY